MPGKKKPKRPSRPPPRKTSHKSLPKIPKVSKPRVAQVAEPVTLNQYENVLTIQKEYGLRIPDPKRRVRYAFQLIRSFLNTRNTNEQIGNLLAANDLLYDLEKSNIFGGDVSNPNYNPYYYFALFFGAVLSRVMLFATNYYKNRTTEDKSLVKKEIWQLLDYIKKQLPFPLDQGNRGNGYIPAMLHYLSYFTGTVLREHRNLMATMMDLACEEDQKFNDYYSNCLREFRKDYKYIYKKTRKMDAKDLIYYGVQEKQVTAQDWPKLKRSLSEKTTQEDVLGMYKYIEQRYQQKVNNALIDYRVGAIPLLFV